MIVVILNGSNGVGKDTFANLCNKYANTEHISSVDYVKEMALKIGWDGIKDEDGRKFLHNLKLTLNAYRDTIWVELMRRADIAQENGVEILFVDIREPEEIDRAKEEFGKKWYSVHTVLVRRDSVKVAKNAADMTVRDYEYDWFVDNNGTFDDLNRIAEGFVHCLLD